MRVRIRFGRGPVVTRRHGKNRRMAIVAGSLSTLVATGCAALGMWRLGRDLDWTGEFVFPRGLLSHWQVWMGAAAAVQYTGLRLTHYARTAGADVEVPAKTSGARSEAAANV